MFTFDISLAIADMESYIAEVRAAISDKWPDSHCIVFGHLGDGNLHVVAAVGDGGREAREAVEQRVYTPLRARNGSVSAEHGIGTEKQPYLSWSRSPEELTLMRMLKDTLDPKGLLNPGKVLPSLQESRQVKSA